MYTIGRAYCRNQRNGSLLTTLQGFSRRRCPWGEGHAWHSWLHTRKDVPAIKLSKVVCNVIKHLSHLKISQVFSIQHIWKRQLKDEISRDTRLISRKPGGAELDWLCWQSARPQAEFPEENVRVPEKTWRCIADSVFHAWKSKWQCLTPALQSLSGMTLHSYGETIFTLQLN